MSLSVFFLLLSFFHPASVSPQVTAETVTDLEQRFTTALLKKDAGALDGLLADDIVHIGFEGQIAGKVEYMDFFKRDIWRYRKYEPTNLKVKVLGNVPWSPAGWTALSSSVTKKPLAHLLSPMSGYARGIGGGKRLLRFRPSQVRPLETGILLLNFRKS